MQASNAARTTASAGIAWLHGWSAAATFEGEFSDLTRSHADKGVARYKWGFAAHLCKKIKLFQRLARLLH